MTRYEFALFVWLRNPPSTIGLRQGDKMENAEARLYLATSSLLSFLFHPRPPPPQKPMKFSFLGAGGGGRVRFCMEAAFRLMVPVKLPSFTIYSSGLLANQRALTAASPTCPPVKKLLLSYCSNILSPGGSLLVPVTHRSQCLMLKTVFKGNINSLIFKVPWMHNIYT